MVSEVSGTQKEAQKEVQKKIQKTALITGASRGIGRATALCLAANGYAVAVNYNTDKAAAEAVCAEIMAGGGRAVAFKADIGEEAAAIELCRAAEAELGAIDLLVNNAGVAAAGFFDACTYQQWRRIFAVNVDGAFFCSRAVLPGMIHRKSGNIINISSIWGIVGASCEVAYSASKGALIAMTKALAKEVGPSGIRVNCVAPGVIDTDMNANLDEAAMCELAEETPLGVIGTPEDIAEAVVFLASEKSRFVTGQVISPNGGFIIF